MSYYTTKKELLLVLCGESMWVHLCCSVVNMPLVKTIGLNLCESKIQSSFYPCFVLVVSYLG
jgi:hypothetical protein